MPRISVSLPGVCAWRCQPHPQLNLRKRHLSLPCTVESHNPDSVFANAQYLLQTERSHEENQERAYVAASRRADRSIEARVQSARMASEIHKKRTGKGFRITEEIVLKEEMYEEEDDDLPRSYRLLGPNMQTASPEMNLKVEAYLADKVAMSALLASTNDEWRENEINRLFAQSFPNAGQQAQRISQHMSTKHLHHVQQQGPLIPPNFQPVTYQPRVHDHKRTPSMSAMSPISPSGLPYYDEAMSPNAAVTPGSISDTSRTHVSHNGSVVSPATPMDPNSISAFTTELPPEANMLIGGVGMYDAFDNDAFNTTDWTKATQFYGDLPYTRLDKTADGHFTIPQECYSEEMTNTMPWDSTNVPDEPWDTFINDNAYASDQ